MKHMLKRVAVFAVIAAIFEIVALLLIHGRVTGLILTALVVLFFLYMAVLAVRGWARQSHIDFPPVMTGRVVRKRHWRLF